VSGKSTGNSRASRSRNGSEGAAQVARAERSSAERGAKARGEDIALVCGMTEDGQGVEVIRKRGDRLEAGTVRKLEAGKPIHGEVVRLRPRAQAPLVCDVEVEFDGAASGRRGEPEAPLGVSSGPAQVATESYRKNWDAVYGRSRKPSLLN
jgi:hypothetical protein